MYRYEPSYEAGETGKNMRQYVKDHRTTFWTILKPLLPFIIGAGLLDVVLTDVFSTGGKKIESPIGAIISAYFITALIISWHRVVIYGPDNFTPMNPFKPKKSELKYIFVGLGLGLAAGLLSVVTIAVAAILNSIVMLIVLIILVPALIFVSLRICFYFPAMATDAPVSLKTAFGMTKGYIWKLFAAGLYASWRLMLVTIAYTIAMVLTIGVFAMLAGTEALDNLTLTTFAYVLSLPIVVYLQPLLTVIGITGLSNYYQHSLQYGGPDAAKGAA